VISCLIGWTEFARFRLVSLTKDSGAPTVVSICQESNSLFEAWVRASGGLLLDSTRHEESYISRWLAGPSHTKQRLDGLIL
jgi:hypothetical protein